MLGLPRVTEGYAHRLRLRQKQPFEWKYDFYVSFKGRFGFRLGMTYVIIGIIALTALITNLLTIILYRGLTRELKLGLIQLDGTIATAIQTVITENIGNISQDTPPALAFIMDMVKSNMKTSAGPDIIREIDGKFK